jgi:hypothetical protein
LAVHLLVGAGMVMSPAWRGTGLASKPPALVTELPATSGRASTHADLPIDLSVPRPHPLMPLLSALRASEDAQPDGVIVDAAPADASQVSRICASPGRRSRLDRSAEEPTVLIHVDENGRVSEGRLLVGSGSDDRDAALLHCLLTLARLTPAHLDGRAVAAWQRLQPLQAETSRRP